MRKIPLTKEKFALVDDEDYEWLNQFKWHYAGNGCARRNTSKVWGKPIHVSMHRVIMSCPDGLVVDHINGDRLDNQKQNLRICTQSENSMNRVLASNNTCGYKGVYWHKGKKRWYAHITINGKQKHIGLFKNIHDAARRYNEKALELFGEFAKVNVINENSDL